LDFENSIEDTELSVFDYHYLYNGGGVGVADFNLDGHKDIFLGGNLVSSSLMIGDGDLHFTDHTTEAGLVTSDWINGISVVDINHDGKPDLYLSVGGPNCQSMESCENLLYLNKSTDEFLKFEEVAEEYGLDIKGYSQQGLFVDVDLDGDLDLYQVQNYVDPQTKNYPKPKRYFSKKSHDKLFINMEVETGVIAFEDRSKTWNIEAPGFGLGIAMTDVNQDGYPDLYIANDFISDDILYINENGKSFRDESSSLLKHTSYNSMGVDIGDINGDLLEDILVVDMLPSNNARQKTMLGAMNYDKYQLSLSEGYRSQFIQNTLQLAHGSVNNQTASFTCISRALGIHQTDWSWSPLIADFDNDTDADIFITNGYGKNITDLDFVNYHANPTGFGSKEQAINKIKLDIEKLPDVKLSNVYFEQTGDYDFLKHNSFKKTITNGAAYADLDGDGDLDIVQNNLNDKATILVNESKLNHIAISLAETNYNTCSIGSQVSILLSDGRWLSKLHSPVESYISTMDNDLVFGTGKRQVEKILVEWVGGGVSTLQGPFLNETIVIDKSTQNIEPDSRKEKRITIFNEPIQVLTSSTPQESNHDFSEQPLLLKQIQNDGIHQSTLRNADKERLIIGYDEHIYQVNSSSFSKTLIHEFNGSLFDLKTGMLDGKPSIVFVSDNEDESTLTVLQETANAWTAIQSLVLPQGKYQVAIGNCNSDDSKEILVAKQPIAKTFPLNPGLDIWFYTVSSDGLKRQEDPVLSEVDGFITDLEFIDLDNDDIDELFVTGEWMTPLLFSKTNGHWTNVFNSDQANLSGLWQSCSFTDADQDGDVDILLANWGINSKLKATHEHPIELVISDLDGNGKADPLVGYYNKTEHKTFCYQTRDDVAKQLPSIKQYYPDYESYGEATFSELLTHYSTKVDTKKMDEMKSVLLENKGDLSFQKRKLPKEIQFSLVNQFHIQDLDKDGKDDILVLMNDESAEIHNGNLDGTNSLVLMNRGNLNYEVLSAQKSGFSVNEPAYQAIELPDNSVLISTNKNISQYTFSNHLLL